MSTARMETILTRLIDEPSHRLRQSIDAERLGALADSIAAEGLHQPIGVRGPSPAGRFEIVWGHRRQLALRLLDWPAVECKVFPWEYDPLLAAGSENLNREQLTALDEAHLIDRYVQAGEPDAAIARLFRRSQTWVHERRDMLTWPATLQEAVHQGEMTIGVARALADVDHPDYQLSLIEEAKRTGASARVVEVWRAHFLADRARIVGNHMAVAAIAAERENWKITVPCELCGDQHDYSETRSVRGCAPCWAAVAALMTEASAHAEGGTPPNLQQ